MLSSRIPYPLTAGFRIRIYNEAKYFKLHGHSVDLLYIGSSQEGNNYESQLIKVFDNVFRIDSNKLEIIKNVFLYFLFTNKPLQVALYKSKQLQKKLDEIYSHYDLIIGNHIRTAEYLRDKEKSKIVLDLHDAISYNYSNAKEIEHGFKKAIYKIEYPRVLKYELEALSLFPRTVLVSDVDKKWLEENGGDVSSVSVISVAVRDDIKNKKSNYEEDENAICFLGKMSYQPNEDAVLWFAQSVFPELVKKYPDLRFYVIGTEPPEEVKKLEKNKNIIVTGFVDNPYELFVKAKATVVPIRNGAGIQNKVLESMMVGTPVVASSIAANGINAINNKQILIADNINEYVDKISQVLESVECRERIGKAGQRYIEENYTWDVLWNKWESFTREVD